MGKKHLICLDNIDAGGLLELSSWKKIFEPRMTLTVSFATRNARISADEVLDFGVGVEIFRAIDLLLNADLRIHSGIFDSFSYNTPDIC